MRLGYDLTIEQTQKLTMTPELIQAIQILQYNSQELEDFVSKEIMENPILEMDNTVPNDSHENLKDPETYPILVQAHRNIISALETHDEDRAAQELQRHIESQANVLAEHIQ